MNPGGARSRCSVCAIALASSAVCGACLHKPPAFDAAFAAFDYAAPIDRLVKQMKFGRTPGLAAWLGTHMAARLPAGFAADLIVPVPLAPRRLRERGFNQAHSLAAQVHASGRAGRAVLRWNLAQRVIDTAALAGLGDAARRSEIRGAFVLTEPQAVAGLHVLVIDDVMTTGATLHEFARTLRRAGAVRVSCLVACRTL
jgi:ComF family protein